jgi:tight adherence protein C
MPIIIPISVFVFVVLGAIASYYLLSGGRNQANERLKDLRNQKRHGDPVILESPVVKIAEKVAAPINRIAPPSAEAAGKLQKRLMHAGFRDRNAPMIFRAIQLASLIVFPLIVVVALTLAGRPLDQSFAPLALGCFAGYVIPRQTLDYLVSRRQERLRWGVADALDLMVVSVEAGLGVNQAMVRVSNELRTAHPEISEEFEMVNTEIRVGRERELAFRNLADRTGVDDLRGLCAMLIQADRFGTSIARAIRVYSDSLRTQRRQRAEQAAQKAAVKLLFPLAVFLFPTLFIILLGPAALQLMDTFGRR